MTKFNASKGKVWNDSAKKWETVERTCKHQFLHYDTFLCDARNDGHCRIKMEKKSDCKPIALKERKKMKKIGLFDFI